MRTLILLALAALAFGCSPSSTEPAKEPTTGATTQASPAPSSGGVAPMGSGAVGGIAPVSGGESVDGAGMGGAGSVAKDMARNAAAKASAPAAGTGTGEGSE